MTEIITDAAIAVVGFVLLMVAVYVIARVWSIAHFRSRTEYDRGEWENWKKREDTNG